ncbi:exodeoxyribonuclease V subunit alpha [uncultured Thiothrix sp.]|uniref:exodeoxyribonuclease V subunit alpha n=1 Tax=uncultured Thiothrix sp. TaxID=223185 RepID=UPI002621F96C|nr:exodeoxyribonuclease V subunit alpha [uncultured Thiothrix sp.]HMT92742.1 exodeoxyribonuclease V subunit alpha [Thiolinea sp.]
MDQYSFLDQQLAALLVRLCAECGYTLSTSQQENLKLLACYTSAATRQGIIAAPLPSSIRVSELEALLASPVIGQAHAYTPLIVEHGHIWLNRYWQYEQQLAINIAQRLKLKLTTDRAALQATLDHWFPTDSQDLQRQAVERAATLPFLIISGGPGTGKTTSVTRLLCLLIEHFKINPQHIKLAAPTGKAAMRMQEAIRQAKTTLQLPAELAQLIPEQGSTLHRLLGYMPGKVGFRHHAHYPLPADVVIVDEASMIDISLMSHLFAAVRPDARLILLGDRDQLASVETGSIFRDLCSVAPHAHPLNQHMVVLEKSWRFDASGGIGELAKAVRDRQEQSLLDILHLAPSGVTWDPSPQISEQYLHYVWQAYLKQVKAWQQDLTQLPALFAAFNQFRLLTPLRKGNLGTEQLNQRISGLLRRVLPNRFQGAWFAGRPVMITENDYRQQLFNGDIGLSLADANGQLRVWFAEPNGSFRAFAPVRLPAHETAWAMTIHKSQGSEFERVLLVLPEDAEAQILGRELLYTGITRARSQIDLMGKQAVILAAVRRSLPSSSCLGWRIAEYSAL